MPRHSQTTDDFCPACGYPRETSLKLENAYTAKEIAQKYRISERTVWDWIDRLGLRVLKAANGAAVRIPASEVAKMWKVEQGQAWDGGRAGLSLLRPKEEKRGGLNVAHLEEEGKGYV